MSFKITQVMFSDTDKPRQLSLDSFSWDSNELSGKFQGCQSSIGFVARWEESIGVFLSNTGVFNQPTDSVVTEADVPVESVTSWSSESAADSPLSTPNPQKKRSA